MWRELEKRCETDLEDGQDLNLNAAVTFVAEIVGEQDGQTLYCTTCWTPWMPDIYAFEVTTEPVFCYLVDVDLEDNGELERIRANSLVHTEADEDYEGAYSEQFHTMFRMIAEKAAEEGYRTETYDDSDDLDDL